MNTSILLSIASVLTGTMLMTLNADAGPSKNTSDISFKSAPALVFIQNKGQVTDQHGQVRRDIDYKLDANGVTLYAGEGQLHYQWMKGSVEKAKEGIGAGETERWSVGKDRHSDKMEPTHMETYRMDVVLVGANRQAKAVAGAPQDYYERYYRAGGEELTVHSYGQVTYKEVYPHIDWVIYSKNNELKYDFVVHPGGDPKQIKLRYEGAMALALKDGILHAATPMGSVAEQAPYSYVADSKAAVSSRYVLEGNMLRFALGSYDKTKDLVIDPSLQWATYYGGSQGETGMSNAMDAAGNIYLAGLTLSTTNIATTGSYQSTINIGMNTSFIAKFNRVGVRQWGTYYEGVILKVAACDPNGNVYVAGDPVVTNPNTLATSGAHQTVLGGNADGLLAKFSSSGSRLWATYYGGSNDDYILSIACDGQGNVYIGGRTGSTTGIATTGTHQSSIGANGDAYIAKFNSSGVRQWGTYYGGNGGEFARAMAIDATGNIYIAGQTNSTSGIATTGAFQTTYSLLVDHSYLAKFNTSGILQWGTYHAGYPNGLATDLNGNVFVGGIDAQGTNIATTGTHQQAPAGDFDGFITKFSSSGSKLWGTYLGGGNVDWITNVATDLGGDVFASGNTYSTSGIATSGAPQSSYGGSKDIILAQFNGTTGTRLWATYYGGSNIDETGDITIGAYASPGLASNGVWMAVAGITYSTSGIATSGAHQTSFGGGVDACLAVYQADSMVYPVQPFNDTVICAGGSISLGYSVTSSFRSGNVFTAQLSDASGSFATPVDIGSVTATTGGSISCTLPVAATAGNNYRIRIVSTLPARTSPNNGIDIRVKAAPIPTGTANSPVCTGSTLNLSATATSGSSYSWTGPGSYSASTQSASRTNMTNSEAGDYIVTATNQGCSAKDTVTVQVNGLPATPIVTNNGPVCPGGSVSFSISNPVSGGIYNWSGPASLSGSSPTLNPVAATDAGVYSVTVTSGCTSLPGTTTLVVKPIPAVPAITSNSPVCLGGTLNLTATSDPGSTYFWSGPNGFNSMTQNPVISPASNATAGTYAVAATLNGCTSAAGTIRVVVNTVALIGAYASPNDTVCKGTLVSFVGFPQNGGNAPVFQWYMNGMPVTTNKVFSTSSLTTGDKLWCTMTATGVCATPVTVSTDTIRMVVQDVKTRPGVRITATPAVTGDPGQEITFFASATTAGPLPSYQWYKNGKPTAITPNWVTKGIVIGDRISVTVTSNDPCAEVATASDSVMVSFPTGISETTDNKGISLYPNPNKGSFTVAGVSGKEVKIEIINAVGQVMYRETARDVIDSYEVHARLMPGSYLLKLMGEGQSRQMRFTVSE